MINKPLKTQVIDKRQKYFDEPIYEVISNASPVALAADRLLNGDHPRIRSRIADVTGYNHFRLRWMSPNTDGKLVPVNGR